jgi:hypothetical protein
MALLGPHLVGRQCHATMNNVAMDFLHCWFSTLSFVAARYRICMPQAWLADQVGLRDSYKRYRLWHSYYCTHFSTCVLPYMVCHCTGRPRPSRALLWITRRTHALLGVGAGSFRSGGAVSSSASPGAGPRPPSARSWRLLLVLLPGGLAGGGASTPRLRLPLRFYSSPAAAARQPRCAPRSDPHGARPLFAGHIIAADPPGADGGGRQPPPPAPAASSTRPLPRRTTRSLAAAGRRPTPPSLP